MPHKLGQVFLKDRNIIEKIVRAAPLSNSESVIEIGCGEGFLTQRLADRSKALYVVELDKRWLDHCKAQCKQFQNISFHHADALAVSLAALGPAPRCIVTNLPYYISAKFFQKLIAERQSWQSCLVMVQKEFANKILAKPGEKSYTSLTIFATAFLNIEKAFNVSKTCFRPIPKIDSTVLILTPKSKPLVPTHEHPFFTFINALFWRRRKTMAAALLKSPYLSLDPDFKTLPVFLQHPTLRAETLTLPQLYEIYGELAPFIRHVKPGKLSA